MSSDTQQFSSLGLIAPLLKAIEETGYTNPTPIQLQAIPLVLDGGDLLAAAQTGTGKTAGFTLPVLQRLIETEASVGKRRPGFPRCLILTPTRELALQIEMNAQTYSKNVNMRTELVFGGVNINRQISALRKPVDILIATPGRLLDLAGQGYLDLSCVEILVLDEADRMLDMGFIHDMKRIIKLLPTQRQTLLFSATFSNEIRQLAKQFLINPKEVSVARRNTASELVDQSVYMVDKPKKRALLAELIHKNQWSQVLVFTKTKHGANRLAAQLGKDGIRADAIHGNKSQSARTRALDSFKNGGVQVLVATDIAARGIDIKSLPNVVNYELPHVSEDYVHRIGRTGRAGSEGQAVSLVDADEVKLLRAIERLINREIPIVEAAGHTGHEIPASAPSKASAKKRPRSRGRNNSSGSSSDTRSPNNRSSERSSSSSKKRSSKKRSTKKPSSSANSAQVWQKSTNRG